MNSIVSFLLSIILSLNIYPTCAVVRDVNHTTGTVTFETATGFQYVVEDAAEDQSVGDLFALIMWDNDTPWTIEDDVPIFGHYSSVTIAE